ncbi:MAG: hypothetical protein N4A41_03530 [Crocinitomicaceae bacterium]|jgi:hypothetical protein|nr:hypothetical protein [Crocinitomicaceae bacterium]
MIRFITTLALFFASSLALAQTGKARTEEVYTPSEITQLKKSPSKRYETILSYAERGFKLSRTALPNVNYIEVDHLYKADKQTTWEIEEFLTAFERKDFNPLTLHWRPGMSTQYYHLRNTNIYFEIPSTKELR